MTEKHTLTVVINVFDDKYCDVYFFTPEYKKWCANLMCSNTFTSFVIDSMYYPLFNTKYNNPEKDLKSLVRTYLNSNFGRVHDMSIHSYFDFSQSYSLEPAFDIDDCVMDEVYVCDYRIGNLYGCSDTSSWFHRVPKLYRADECMCDETCVFHLVQEDLDDVISTVKRCGDVLETFGGLSLYAVKDDRGIELCPFSVGNKDYFVQNAREHANDKNYLTHKTYVYEYKNGKTNKIYGCCKFNEDSNVVALNLDKEDACNKESNSMQCCEDKIDTINNSYDAFRADNFNFTVDNVEVLSSYCTEVSVLYQKGKIIVKAKFYLNKATQNVITSNAFNIGSKHKLYISAFNDDSNEHEGLLSLATFNLTKKFYCLNKKGIDDPLEEELTFESGII
jgi:hypothetical protein